VRSGGIRQLAEVPCTGSADWAVLPARSPQFPSVGDDARLPGADDLPNGKRLGQVSGFGFGESTVGHQTDELRVYETEIIGPAD